VGTPRLTGQRRTHFVTRAKLRSCLEFSPDGYDERQYCSPGFSLAVGCLMRSVLGSFPEYHTSADNLTYIRPLQLPGSVRACAAIVDVVENNRRHWNENLYCEPQLGRRNLYPSTGGERRGTDIRTPLGVEYVRRTTFFVGHCEAFRYALPGFKRRGGVVLLRWPMSVVS
jgi:Domain of unknown function (DUF4910)